jgi:hypothetical protein
MDSNVAIVRRGVPHAEFTMAGLDVGGVNLAYKGHTTMQAHHRHMQELFGQHTVSMVDAALDSAMRERSVLVIMVQV